MWKFAMEIPRVQEKVPGHGAYAANSFLALGDVGLEGLREREGAITTIQCQHYNSSTAFSSVFAFFSYFLASKGRVSQQHLILASD
jgi:hypothetical protein